MISVIIRCVDCCRMLVFSKNFHSDLRIANEFQISFQHSIFLKWGTFMKSRNKTSKQSKSTLLFQPLFWSMLLHLVYFTSNNVIQRLLESYPLCGYILGSGAPGTNAVGASGAINGMKCWSMTYKRTYGWTDRCEGENSGLDEIDFNSLKTYSTFELQISNLI